MWPRTFIRLGSLAAFLFPDGEDLAGGGEALPVDVV